MKNATVYSKTFQCYGLFGSASRTELDEGLLTCQLQTNRSAFLDERFGPRNHTLFSLRFSVNNFTYFSNRSTLRCMTHSESYASLKFCMASGLPLLSRRHMRETGRFPKSLKVSVSSTSQTGEEKRAKVFDRLQRIVCGCTFFSERSTCLKNASGCKTLHDSTFTH